MARRRVEKPLGTETPEGREAEIKAVQDEAIARSKASETVAWAGEQRLQNQKSDQTSEEFLDRVYPAPKAFDHRAVGAGGGDEACPQDMGEPVRATYPEEVYGLKGTFSSYRVGPFSSETTVRPGEGRVDAFARLMRDLHEVAKAERVKARDAFLDHLNVAFTKE